MSKKAFYATFGGIVLIVATLACSLSGSSPSATQLPNQSPTSSILIQPSPTESPSLSPTPIPQTGLKQEWTIKTGDIQYIGVASDGTIYGVGDNLYAVISKDGNVLQTNEMDFKKCFYNKHEGGSGNVEIDLSFVIKPDGTILSKPLTGFPCIISPGNPPVIERLANSDYFPYADEISVKKTPALPDGFNYHYVSGWFFSYTSGPVLSINTNKKTAAFVDHNGDLRYFDFPQDVDLDKHADEIQFVITPWDHVYYSYPVYDGLGNNIGEKNIRVDENGISNLIPNFPQLRPDSVRNNITNLIGIYPLYLPKGSEVYYYQNNALIAYDLNFNYLREYSLPPGFPEISYGFTSSTNKSFIGHDGAVYVFDIAKMHGRTLTKYLLPSNSTQVQTNSVLQPTLDQEAILFRDETLEIIQGFDTLEYIFESLITIDHTGPVKETSKGIVQTTKTATHGIDDRGNTILETIIVEGEFCYRTNNESWECSAIKPWTPFLAIKNILEGNKPDDNNSDSRVIAHGSNLDTFNGSQCRSFFVEVLTTDANWEQRDEICFDLGTHYPLYWLSKATGKRNGVVNYESTVKYFEFKFNVPVEEIVLPQQ